MEDFEVSGCTELENERCVYEFFKNIRKKSKVVIYSRSGILTDRWI